MVILRNLISNAIKFTHPGGNISIIVIPGTNLVEISISDNGVGINKKKIKTLFKISSNGTSVGTANEKGSGLGLVLCIEFVEKLVEKSGLKVKRVREVILNLPCLPINRKTKIKNDFCHKNQSTYFLIWLIIIISNLIQISQS
jgi:signal transduction histidine kinase